MTLESQRIAIAEACGKLKCWPHEWQNQTWPGSGYVKDNPPDQHVIVCRKCNKVRGRLVLDDTIGKLPDYLNDLNAMHEAEKKFFNNDNDELKRQYINKLCYVTLGEPCDGEFGLHRVGIVTRATASQRAEAFLRTLGLWKEEGKQ